MAQKKLYNDQLRVVADFLTESKLKTDYILSLFYDRGNIELEETSMLEGNNSQAHKVQMKQEAKDKAIQKIKKLLTNFRNGEFKTEVANFIQWIVYQSDPPTLVGYQYPTDLKLCLLKVKRYEGDLEMLVGDVNEKFKNLV